MTDTATPADRLVPRVAVIATPRSGNTWLRGMLAAMTGATEIAHHSPDDIAWDSLPAAVALQIHWPPTHALVTTLARHSFRVVTISRHPLDVLISILHFCRHEAQTSRWLDGAGGNEEGLKGAAPQDDSVLAYARGPRFRSLLGVTASWWDRADATVGYEELVADTPERLRAVAELMGARTGLPELRRIAESRALDAMRPTSSNHHYWQGNPGGWRRLLPADRAEALAAPVADILESLGYRMDPDAGLTSADARRNWEEIERRS